MKKILTVILSILACLCIAACEEPGTSVIPPVDGTQTEQGGTEGGSKNESQGGGNVVTPIQPGGDYNAGGYGK